MLSKRHARVELRKGRAEIFERIKRERNFCEKSGENFVVYIKPKYTRRLTKISHYKQGQTDLRLADTA